MPALFIAPAPTMPTAPPAAAPAANGAEDGLFAAKLQAASEQQQAAPRQPSQSAGTPADKAEMAATAPPDGKTSDETGEPTALDSTTLNGAATQQPPVPREPETIVAEEAFAASRSVATASANETAIARMLSLLAAGEPVVSAPANDIASGAHQSAAPVAELAVPVAEQPSPAVSPTAVPQTAPQPVVSALPPVSAAQPSPPDPELFPSVTPAAPPAAAVVDAASQTSQPSQQPMAATSPPAAVPARAPESTVTQMLNALATGQSAVPARQENPADRQLMPAAGPFPAPRPLPGGETQPLIATTSDELPVSGVIPGQAAAQSLSQSAAAPPVATAGTNPTDQGTTAQPDEPLIVQNKYGQIIAIAQSRPGEEEAAISATTGTTAPAAADSQSLDVTSNYMRSRLPNEIEAARSSANDNGEQRQNASRDQQTPSLAPAASAASAETGLTEQPFAVTESSAASQESQPLVFAHQRTNTPFAASSSSAESSLFRLPSGAVVPEGTVVDQMIAHFSMNKRLETSTVNLKLHPQELGELRMEIKVEQDNIKAHIIAQTAQSQDMIDRHLPRLREALAQQGLNLQQVEITVAANDHAGGERFQDNGGWQQPDRSPRHRTDQPLFSGDLDEASGDEAAVAGNLSVLA